MSGPPPTPTKLKVLRGNPGKRPLPASEPEPQGEATKPSWLRPGPAQVWDQYAPELLRLGLLTSLDGDTFGQWCSLAALFRKMGPAKMPANKMARMDAIGSKFGLDPSSRSRLGTKAPGKPRKERFFA